MIFVGDARMAYSELFDRYGCIDYYYSNDKPGIEWLRRIKEHFPYSVWLNPTPKQYWRHPTVEAIGQVVPHVRAYPRRAEGRHQGAHHEGERPAA